MLHACIAQTSERDGTHGCVHRVANYVCRVAAKGGIRITSGHYDRRNSIVCDLDFGHVTGPLKATGPLNTRTCRIPGNGNVTSKKPGFLGGEICFIWKWRKRRIWDEPKLLRNALVHTWRGQCGVTMFLTPAPLYVRTN